MKRKWIALTGIALGIGMTVLFFALEDLSGPMVLVNRYTPLFIGGAVLSVTALVLFLKKKDRK